MLSIIYIYKYFIRIYIYILSIALRIDEVMYVEQKYIRVKFACCFRHSEIYQIDHTKIIAQCFYIYCKNYN